jgi:hypothetical protein
VRTHPTGCVVKVDEFRTALDANAGLGQAIDQKALVLILWKDLSVRKRAEAPAHLTEDRPRHMFASHPYIRGENLPSTFDDFIGQTYLTVQFERTRLHG